MSHVASISLRFPVQSEQQHIAFADLRRLVTPAALGQETRVYFPRMEIVESADPWSSLVINDLPATKFAHDSDLSSCSLISFSDVVQRFDRHVVRVDHMGVNFPAQDSEGRALLMSLSRHSLVYAYPGNEPWYFAIPATAVELQQGFISDFTQVRFPKFEVVFDGEGIWRRIVQIDLVTNLCREDVEQRLPAPYGFSLPGLEMYFRSVYVAHPWDGFLLRMDFRFHCEDFINEWSTCEWLVREGKRFRPQEPQVGVG